MPEGCDNPKPQFQRLPSRVNTLGAVGMYKAPQGTSESVFYCQSTGPVLQPFSPTVTSYSWAQPVCGLPSPFSSLLSYFAPFNLSSVHSARERRAMRILLYYTDTGVT